MRSRGGGNDINKNCGWIEVVGTRLYILYEFVFWRMIGLGSDRVGSDRAEVCRGRICYKQDHLVPHQITRQQTIGSKDDRNKVSKWVGGLSKKSASRNGNDRHLS